MADSIEIQGFCEPGFEPLRDVFEAATVAELAATIEDARPG